MTWNPLDEPYDRVWIAQKWSPGLCDIDQANSPREWEERPGYGWSGSFLWFKGIRLAHFVLRFRLYTAEDWAAWELFRPMLDRPPVGTRPRALDIWHPILVAQGIYAMAVEDLGQATQSEDGVWTVEVKCIEWRVPKYSLSQPDGAKAAAVDPYEQRIEWKTAEVERLAERR